MDRRLELQTNLQVVEREISDACIAANRNRSDVTLIAVTKTWPASDVDLLAGLGITDVGENRDQEAKPKHEEVLAKTLTWHAIGQLQTNKAKSVAAWADVVHSVDRTDLVTALTKAVTGRERPLSVLIQANLDPNPTENRGGALPNELLNLAELISQSNGLHLQGIMGVAPLAGNDDLAFSKLQGFASEIQDSFPEANWISAGMSGDFATALKYGATHLRIGSSILGNRGFQG
ncbi:MAG: YggS family pyridoxal phosphate-dependent enzyme [Candidatus Nanopelagicales bacterium]|nr:YggS family pyridoxal phosphate-dependent enzyme [Candidatus Nanopelagicales bacterium]